MVRLTALSTVWKWGNLNTRGDIFGYTFQNIPQQSNFKFHEYLLLDFSMTSVWGFSATPHGRTGYWNEGKTVWLRVLFVAMPPATSGAEFQKLEQGARTKAKPNRRRSLVNYFLPARWFSSWSACWLVIHLINITGEGKVSFVYYLECIENEIMLTSAWLIGKYHLAALHRPS